MQVPVVAAHVMDWVSMADPDAATLMEQIKETNVFKVYHWEARVLSTHSTPREWWVWGKSQMYHGQPSPSWSQRQRNSLLNTR